MWLLMVKYFKSKTAPKQALPDQNEELSKKIPSSGISSAHVCLGKLLDGDEKNSRPYSRGPYTILTPAQKFSI